MHLRTDIVRLALRILQSESQNRLRAGVMLQVLVKSMVQSTSRDQPATPWEAASGVVHVPPARFHDIQ